MYRPMVPEDEATLRMMLNIREPMALPKVVVENYWTFRGFLDRAASGPMSVDMLAFLCWTSNLRVPKTVGPAVVQCAKDGKVRRGDPIIVVWRDQFVEAVFQALKPNGKVEAILKGDETPVAREFDPFDVEVPDTSLQAS